MSIFSNLGFSNIDDMVIESSYDMELGGAYDSIMESCDDELAIIEAMHAFDMAEIAAMKESGSTTDYEVTPAMESSLSDIWAKIKAFFKKMYDTVMGYLKTAVEFFDRTFLSGAEFIKKYEGRLNKLDLTGFKFNMFEYSYDENDFNGDFKKIENFDAQIRDDVKKIKEMTIDAKDPTETVRKLSEMMSEMSYANENKLDSLRGEIAAGSGKLGADEFRKELHDQFRGDGQKHDVGAAEVKIAINKLKNVKKISNDVKTAKEKINKNFKELNTYIDQCASEAKNVESKDGKYKAAASKKAAAIRMSLSLSKSAKTIMTIYISEWSSAIREATSAYKNLCFRALQWKPSNT